MEMGSIEPRVTTPLFEYLVTVASPEESLVTQIFASWNPLTGWLRQFERLRHAA